MTYAVHFRIPFYLLNRKHYVNGSYFFDRSRHLVKGDLVQVEDILVSSGAFTAEVIEITHTSRLPHEYNWREVSYDVKG